MEFSLVKLSPNPEVVSVGAFCDFQAAVAQYALGLNSKFAAEYGPNYSPIAEDVGKYTLKVDGGSFTLINIVEKVDAGWITTARSIEHIPVAEYKILSVPSSPIGGLTEEISRLRAQHELGISEITLLSARVSDLSGQIAAKDREIASLREDASRKAHVLRPCDAAAPTLIDEIANFDRANLRTIHVKID